MIRYERFYQKNDLQVDVIIIRKSLAVSVILILWDSLYIKTYFMWLILSCLMIFIIIPILHFISFCFMKLFSSYFLYSHELVLGAFLVLPESKQFNFMIQSSLWEFKILLPLYEKEYKLLNHWGLIVI